MELQLPAVFWLYLKSMGWGLAVGLVLAVLFLLWRKLSSGQFFPPRRKPTRRFWFYLGIVVCLLIAAFCFWKVHLYAAITYVVLAFLFWLAMVVHWRRWRY